MRTRTTPTRVWPTPQVDRAEAEYAAWVAEERVKHWQWEEQPADTLAIQQGAMVLRSRGFVREADYAHTDD